MKKPVLSTVLLVAAGTSLFAGPFTGDTVGTAYNSPAVQEWADQVVSITRGPADIQDPVSQGGSLVTFGNPSEALGPSDAAQNSINVVSLGDGGSITLSFAQPIGNGPGADFSVFENGFEVNDGTPNQAFLELAFVSVSSDGVNFFTFPSTSLTSTTTDQPGTTSPQVGTFGLLDATNIDGLAGKTIAGVGTDFDLQKLAGVSPLLNVNDVQYVRVTDVVGDINPAYATKDSEGNIINDPYPTVFPSGGFDLDAVAVLNIGSVPEPGTWAMLAFGLVLLVALRNRIKLRALAACAAVLTTGFAQAQTIIDFSSLTPSTPYTEPGASTPSGAYTNDQSFAVQGLNFNNSFDADFDSWSGFAYSNATNKNTFATDFEYQYSAAGTGISTFAIGYYDGFDPDPTISLPQGEQPLALSVTNTVYTELSMEKGDSFASAMTYAAHSYLVLDINGLNAVGQSTGEVQFYLADFRTSDSPGILENWAEVNLSSLGAGTTTLDFSEESSDTGDFGINTPAYFALGNLTVAEVPEPSLGALLLLGCALLVVYKRNRARA